MTDNEIIKALECCCSDHIHACDRCPFREQCDNSEFIEKYAADLINRQKAEIERLTVNMNAFGLGMKREAERADTARAEAVKEFAERLKEKADANEIWIGGKAYTFYMIREDKLDNLVNELKK